MNRFIGKTLTSVVNKDNKELIHRRLKGMTDMITRQLKGMP